ncbi:MAG: SWIM zinc finger family protein [Thainema sp.]
MTTFSDILDDDLLLKVAGQQSYERGVDYFERGAVHSLAQYGDRITADVYGTEAYQVQLWLEDAELKHRCTCPVGVEGWFCKQCVAVALSWIDEPPSYRPAGDAPAKTGTTMQDVHDYLAQQDRETLVQMILDQAMEDTHWREKLLMKAAFQQRSGADINTFRRVLRNAIAVGDFVDYYAAYDYSNQVQSAVDGLEELFEAGYASEVIELSEEAMDLLDDALNSVDDSSGYLGTIMDQVQELHYRACERAKPNPRALAQRLFRMELASGYGFFYNALETYADILGEAGREAYQELVDEEWEKLPPISQSERHSFNYRRSQLNRMKETLVAHTGSLEDLVTVIAKDLSQPSRYLQIARLYQDANRTEDAIAWAEDGLEAFKNDYLTGQLGDFLVTAYEQQGRVDDAVDIVWRDFTSSPSLPLYQKLKRQAEKANKWPELRSQALAQVQQKTDEARQSKQSTYGQRFGYSHRDYSLLVEIYLWEGNIDQAWQAALTGGCHRNLWMRLAERRAADHPEDALSVYLPAVEPLINQTNNDAYLQAVDLLVQIKDLMARLNRQTEFDTLLTEMSTNYKRKRNFIKFLTQAGLI